MVQFKDVRYGVAQNKHGDWWKLPNLNLAQVNQLKETMRKNKYFCPKSATRKATHRHFIRYRLGQLLYVRREAHELRKFCEDRNLLAAGNQTLEPAEMIALLESADRDQTFNRLLDLPAELRVLIYTFYFSSFGVLDAPAQPPLAKASRLLRKEALPVFYSTCRFKLDYMGSSRPCPTRAPAKFWPNVPQDHLKWIRNIELTGPVCNLVGHMDKNDFVVDLSAVGEQSVVALPSGPMVRPLLDLRNFEAVTETVERLKRYLDRMRARGGGIKLIPADISGFRQLFRTGFTMDLIECRARRRT
jgi:hypothetical protein